MRRAELVLLGLLLGACSHHEDAPPRRAPEAPAEPAAPTTPPQAPAPDAPDEASRALDEALEGLGVAPSADGDTTAPEPRSCVVEGRPQPVWQKPAAASVVAVPDGYVIALHAAGERGGEELVVLRVDARGRGTPLARIEIPPVRGDLLPPGLGVVGPGRVGVGSIDGRAELRYLELASIAGGPAASPRIAATTVDARFPPAILAIGDRRIVAYTKLGSPSHVVVTSFGPDGASPRTHDVTALECGASAPVAARGSNPPAMIFVDPREGLSPLHRVTFDAEGVPSEPSVVHPVTAIYAPARIAAALGAGELHLAYTAYATANATAVGYVRGTPRAPDPVSLVRATGFGPLWVDAAPIPGGVAFAATAPTEREAGTPREIHVRVADAQGLGEALVLPTAPGGLRFPSLAAGPEGRLALVYSTGMAVELVHLRCRAP